MLATGSPRAALLALAARMCTGKLSIAAHRFQTRLRTSKSPRFANLVSRQSPMGTPYSSGRGG